MASRLSLLKLCYVGSTQLFRCAALGTGGLAAGGGGGGGRWACGMGSSQGRVCGLNVKSTACPMCGALHDKNDMMDVPFTLLPTRPAAYAREQQRPPQASAAATPA